MPKVMIMSLGGSPEPLTKSIETHRPQHIIFLASQDSLLKAGDVLNPLTVKKPKPEFEITEDPNIMFECYKAARRCVDRVRKLNAPSNDVMVDYTGGTKVMTAALILATIGQPYQFNYVGGQERTKEGLGVVVNGHEKMYPEMSPWSIFAEEERRQVVTLFNRRRYSAVIQIIDSCSQELPLEIQKYFSFVRPMAEGLLFWEQFNHKEANTQLSAGLGELHNFLKLFPVTELEGFYNSVQKCKEFLERLISTTRGLQEMKYIVIDDLLNNARRRISDRRYDDAAARIYRALELCGQIAFIEKSGYTNDRVKEEEIPSPLRADFVKKYRDPASGFLKLPLEATFKYLHEKGHDAGIRFFEMHREIKKIQTNRNYSILAHGIQPVTESGIQSIYKTVTDFVKFKNVFDFPLLP
jgi:CRISPR-associated protein (TIGR02710 family)